MLKKVFILVLALQLSLPANIFAGALQDKPAKEMSKEEIALLISKTDTYNISLSPVTLALITATVVGLGYATVKMAYFIGDVKGFSRGYLAKEAFVKDANKTIAESLKKAEEKGFQQGLIIGRKKGSAAAYKFFMEGKPKSDNLIYVALKENEELFSKKLAFAMELLARSSKGKGNTSRLILKLVRQTAALKTIYQVPTTQGGMALEPEILKTMDALTKASSKSSKEVRMAIDLLITEARTFFRKPSAKGGIAGGALLAIFGTAAYLWAENEGNPSLISNKRAFVEEDLSSVYKATPELLAAKILVYKEMFGLDFVSSVVYENRAVYGQAAVNQLEFMSSAEIKDLAASLERDAVASKISFDLKDMKSSGFNPLPSF